MSDFRITAEIQNYFCKNIRFINGGQEVMTTLVVWVGADSRGPASLNIATDSRISWNRVTWDFGRKTFVSKETPDIFGYVNDVMFPTMILGQVVSLIESGCLFSVMDSVEKRFNTVFKYIEKAFISYPDRHKQGFSIFHASRENDGMKSIFGLNVITAKKSNGIWVINSEKLAIPTISSSLCISGSGKLIAEKWTGRWDSSSQGGTSRAVFSGFCDAVLSGEDHHSYGAPQIVSLYRKGNGNNIAFSMKNKSFLSGVEFLSDIDIGGCNIDFRNRFFERCQSNGELLAGAKDHHVPKGLGGKE
ncbi:hypothetical protein [Aeromonas taiwanensis]|uniref:hypothetical protein n=1 Tax=Aeromonas taiwanensis TaxID=633417 RepID=UPI00207C25D4|nr:hypothetical protein [Aeromonas taiwanensis]MCO4204065.1 hypothetical protein [Aeromonas taiwanensis]